MSCLLVAFDFFFSSFRLGKGELFEGTATAVRLIRILLAGLWSFLGRVFFCVSSVARFVLCHILSRPPLFPCSSLPPGQFIYVIRKRIKLDPEKAIFIFVNDTIPQTCERETVSFLVLVFLRWLALVFCCYRIK